MIRLSQVVYSFVIGHVKYLAGVTYIILANDKFKQTVCLRTASTTAAITGPSLTV